ncbi:MAG TPA: AMP-binding protein [Kofleriaceae bacterium]|nr:AMP-binding protein [Kofleriaceae bacterium]
MSGRLKRLRARVDRARFFASVIRSSRVVAPVRPARLAKLVRGARQTKPGPHLAVMYQAAAHPDKEAVVEYGEHGVRRMSWSELDATVNRLANALAARGVHGGSRVALMLPNGREYLIAQQALARMGAMAVQIGYRLKPGEIAFILDNSKPVATIVQGAYLDTMRAARAQIGHASPMIVCHGAIAPGTPDSRDADEWDRALAAASPDVPPRTRGGDGGGVIVYTSGTTGKPKGATRNWRKTGFESAADMILQCGMRSDDRHLVVCPLYHSAAPAFVAIMQSLGATCVLQNHWDPEQALAIIQKERITCSVMVPTMLVRICALPPETLAKYDTSSLRWIMSAAAPLTTEAARRFMDRFGPILWNFYGATETGLVTLAGPHDHVSRPGTIGRAMRGNDIRLIGEDGREVSRGQVGELYVRNVTLMSGYHGNDEATNEAQRAGFYSVGDLARVDADGYYFLESRKHDMVISGGVNIYPREIEDHLQTHPAILEAAVVGVPDPDWGESLRAFVVLRAGAHLVEAEVIDFCRKELADYKRPRRVTFLHELPRNPTGKVLKRELRDMP